MSIDADVLSAISDVTGSNVGAAPADDAVDPDVIIRSTGIERPAPPPRAPAKPNAAAPAAQKPATTDDGDDGDPLDDKHFTEEALNTPEKREAARARLFKHLNAVKEMTRKAHRAHGAAGIREEKIAKREQAVTQREQAAAAYDRAFQASVADLQSGDADRFLTGLHRLSNVGDPAGFWRTISLKLASGGTFTDAEKKQVQADPELQRRLATIEEALKAREQTDEQRAMAEHEERVAAVKARNLQLAVKNDATPRVVAYASDPRTAQATSDALAQIMLDHHERTGRALTIAQACASLEESLAVHYELSQRADGQTNGEKGTTGSEPDAGRATSKDLPPKPGEQPRTIPAQLGASPAVAKRPLTDREQREATVQGLDAIGFFSRIGL